MQLEYVSCGYEIKRGCDYRIKRGCEYEMKRGCDYRIKRGCDYEIKRGCEYRMKRAEVVLTVKTNQSLRYYKDWPLNATRHHDAF